MQHTNKRTWLLLAALLALPLISMVIVPFYDTSEPRYAEIARIMAQSGDWITPWFSPSVPFWGKPPLSFWAQALSMKLFGFSEFAARLPSWLCLLLTNGIIIAGLRPLLGPRIALFSALIYSSCTLVYISSGAVLTDPFLALGTTLSLVSFAVAASGRDQYSATSEHPASETREPTRQHTSLVWRYGFFLGLAIGLLSKGPLALVLSLAPILVWYAFERKTATLSSILPWGRGLILMAALSLPWYVLAELKTPGFLDYFIVGEHFRRFLDPGWAGDLYGSAHKRAYGTIWLYWLQASFPWGLIVLAALVGGLASARLRATILAASGKPLFRYWLAGALITPLFFTFSANILWTYILPSLAGFSIAAAILAEEICARFGISRNRLRAAAGFVPIAVLAFSLVVWMKPNLRNTEEGLIQYTQRQGRDIPLVYLSKAPFSARFYSAGKAQGVTQRALLSAARCGTPFYLAVPKHQQDAVAGMLRQPLHSLYSNKRYSLVTVSPPNLCAEEASGSAPTRPPQALAGQSRTWPQPRRP